MFKIIKNKKLRVFIIILLILIIIGIIIYFIINSLKSNYRSFYKVGDELILEEVYNTVFNEIDIETKMSDINIKESTDNTVKIAIYGEKDYINIKEKNNKLFIDVNKKNFIAFDFYKYISKIELYLPINYSNVIRIDNEFGNIEVDDFENVVLYVEKEYGDIRVLNGDFIKIYNDNGNIDLEKVNKVRIENSSGDISIGNVNDVVIENEYGDISIESVYEYLGLINESGDIKIDNIILEKDSSIKTEYGDVEVGTISDIYVDAKTENGKVKIENNYKDSEITLKIHNESGDIKVDS